MTQIGAYEHGLAKYYHDAVRAFPAFACGVRTLPPAAPVRRPYRSACDKITPAAAAIELGKQGICVWDGDFYAARPVQVLGLAERGGLLRTGVSMYNTREELDRLLAGLEKLA